MTLIHNSLGGSHSQVQHMLGVPPGPEGSNSKDGSTSVLDTGI